MRSWRSKHSLTCLRRRLRGTSASRNCGCSYTLEARRCYLVEGTSSPGLKLASTYGPGPQAKAMAPGSLKSASSTMSDAPGCLLIQWAQLPIRSWPASSARRTSLSVPSRNSNAMLPSSISTISSSAHGIFCVRTRACAKRLQHATGTFWSMNIRTRTPSNRRSYF